MGKVLDSFHAIFRAMTLQAFEENITFKLVVEFVLYKKNTFKLVVEAIMY